MSTGRKISQNARGPAPSERDAAAASVKAPTTNTHADDRQERESAEAVDAVHEHLREPLLIGPGRAEPVDRSARRASEAVLITSRPATRFSQLSLTMSAGGKIRRKMRPNPASRTTRMYSSSAMRRSRPFRTGEGSTRCLTPCHVPEGSEPTGLTVDVIPYSSA